MKTVLKSQAHSVYRIYIHIVFVTKYRHPVITPEVLERLKQLFSKLCLSQKSELTECNSEADHVHLLVDMAPDIAVSKLVNILKTISSREIRKEFASYLKPYYWKPVFWKRGYCAVSAGGAPLTVVKQYIENQGRDD